MMTMMTRLSLVFLGIVLAVGVAAAQTATTQSTPPATTSSTGTGASGDGTTTTNPNAGAFEKLSPGNQKIAQALFEAQKAGGAPPDSHLTRDDIAAMKLNRRGWGNVFKDMKAQGLVAEKNLGQAVSKYQHQKGASAPGPVTTTGGAAGAKAGTTSGTASHGKDGKQGAYKSTGGTITSGSNQTSTGGPGHRSQTQQASGGNGKGSGITTGMSGTHGAGAAHGAKVTSGGGQSGGGPASASHGRGK